MLASRGRLVVAPSDNREPYQRVSNRVMAAPPGHELVDATLALLPPPQYLRAHKFRDSGLQSAGPYWITGPHILGLALSWAEDGAVDTTVPLPHDWIYPRADRNQGPAEASEVDTTATAERQRASLKRDTVMFGHNRDREMHSKGTGIFSLSLPTELVRRRRALPNYFTVAAAGAGPASLDPAVTHIYTHALPVLQRMHATGEPQFNATHSGLAPLQCGSREVSVRVCVVRWAIMVLAATNHREWHILFDERELMLCRPRFIEYFSLIMFPSAHSEMICLPSGSTVWEFVTSSVHCTTEPQP